jgi:hypothetical protein
MAEIPELLAKARKGDTSAVAELLALPTKQKQEKVHAELAKIFAAVVGSQDYQMSYVNGALAVGLAADCAESPELVGIVCAALRPVAKTARGRYVAAFAMLTNAPAAFVLANDMDDVEGYHYLIGLEPSVGPKLLAELNRDDTYSEFSGEAGILLGLDVRASLRKKIKRWKDCDEALALAGHPDDADVFKRGVQKFAKTLYTATSPGKSTARVAATRRLEGVPLAKVAYGKLLADPDPAVAQAALAQLELHTREPYERSLDAYFSCLWHGSFLRSAAARIAAGAPAAERKVLEKIHARIPLAPPLPAAAPVAAKPKTPKIEVSKEVQALCDALAERARLRQDEAQEKELPKPSIEAVAAGILVRAGFADAVVVGADKQVRAAQPDGTPGKKSLGTVAAATKAIRGEIDAMEALLATQEAADLMTAIKKKEVALEGEKWREKRDGGGEPESGRIYRFEKLIEVFILGKGGYLVKRDTGVVCKWRGQAKPGATLFPSLDEAIVDLKAELRRLGR